MAYQTGSVSDVANLIAAIKTFAQANGWSVSSDIIYKGDIYAKVYASTFDSQDTVALEGGTGQSGGALTGPSGYISKLLMGTRIGDPDNSWPMTYYLFAHSTPDQISLFVNYNSVWWQNLSFGEIEKYGDYVGGQFYHAQGNETGSIYHGDTLCVKVTEGGTNSYNHSSAPFWGSASEATGVEFDGSSIHIEIDSQIWWTSSSDASNNLHRVNVPQIIYPMLGRSNATWNEMSTLVPYYIGALRPDDKMSIIGSIAHFRPMRLDNHVAGDLITIGSDQYKVFPWIRQTSEETPVGVASGVWGVAVEYDGP